jgi:hypothetical protein
MQDKLEATKKVSKGLTANNNPHRQLVAQRIAKPHAMARAAQEDINPRFLSK